MRSVMALESVMAQPVLLVNPVIGTTVQKVMNVTLMILECVLSKLPLAQTQIVAS